MNHSSTLQDTILDYEISISYGNNEDVTYYSVDNIDLNNENYFENDLFSKNSVSEQVKKLETYHFQIKSLKPINDSGIFIQ